LNVLLRKEQRNPLLTGEAGVGKTALAIALAQKIASGKVPRMLQGHRVVEINGANLMSGTSYRGDLESRIKGLLEEASQGVILFIDEAHAVFAPRAGSHAPAEIPNHFKSALASGDIAVVAATTEAEYRRWIEQDPALKRRFERVEIGEPSMELVRAILGSLVEDLQRDYEVEVDPAAIPSAIELSVKFIPEQRLPDKAKKLLMDACIARANAVVEAVEGEPISRRVTAEDVARQVNQKTNIPLERLLRGDIHWWVGIEERLREEVVGQDQAIRDVARALVSGRLRSAQQARPLGVLLFAGPQGVGKGTLASALTHEFFGSKSAIIRLDMTDYQEPHSISRLIGSPPGYVGYEDEDMLVTPLRRRPSSVVLLEDFDRAHPQIQDRILRLLREGEIADTRGYKADVRNAVFILSVHVELGASASRIGFGAEGADVPDAVKLLSQWDRQFAARVGEQVDAVILFRELTGEGASPALDVLKRRISMFVQAMMAEYRIEVELDAALREELDARASVMRDARSVEGLVESMLYQTITDALLAGTCEARCVLVWEDGEVSVRGAEPR
jgi:ATP-dependent Clp protease ATP-binding subunit ClpC